MLSSLYMCLCSCLLIAFFVFSLFWRLNLQREGEKAKKEEKKEKQWEKKEKEKAWKNGQIDNKKHRHIKRHKEKRSQESQKGGDQQKGGENEA